MAIDFEALLDVKVDDVKEPLPYPGGLYTAKISPNMEFGESSKKGTPFVQLEFDDAEPGPEVDEGAFEEARASRSKEPSFKATFYLIGPAMFMLTNFMKHVGVNTTGRTVKDCLTDLPGEMVGIYVKVDTLDDGRAFNPRIEQFCPAP